MEDGGSLETGFDRSFDIMGIGRVHECGKLGKPLVILLHGFMQSGLSWQRIAPLLKHHHVLAPDLLGHGRTLWKTGSNLDLEAYVQQVDALVEWARTTYSSGETFSIHLVGYSMGGRIAALYALRYPEKVAALVLESAGLGPQTEEERTSKAAKSAKMIEELDRSVTQDPKAPLEAFVSYWEKLPLFETQSELPEHIRARIRVERLANDSCALRCNLEEAGQHHMIDVREGLVEIDKPLLYIVGERDVAYTKTARSLMRAWAERGTGSNPFDQGFLQISVIPRVGHNVHLEAPEEYGLLVDLFLARAS